MDADAGEFLKWINTRLPNAPGYDPVARAYKNAKGIDEIIYLTRNYWDYVDWLEGNGDIVFAEWVVHCDNNPVEGYSLSHQLMFWLWTDECNRFREGLPTPNAHPPMGYEGWADEFHADQKN